MRLPHITFGKVLAGTAVLMVATSGAAYAAGTIGSADIINGSVKSIDVKNNSLKSIDILNGSLTGNDVANGSITGIDIADSSLSTADVLDGTLTGDDVADNSITGGDVADESLTSADLGVDSVQATEIADGSIDSGEIVDFGLSNQDVGVLFATVNGDGTLNNSSGGVTTAKLGTGQYQVNFGLNVSFCAFTGTVGDPGTGIQTGIMDVADRAGNANAVFVETRDAAGGALADRAFHLIVVC